VVGVQAVGLAVGKGAAKHASSVTDASACLPGIRNGY
jgi:hypothetical protein